MPVDLSTEPLYEEHLTSICEMLPDGIVIVDRGGHITFANAVAERILRMSRGKVNERTYNDPVWKITALDGAPFPEDKLPFVRVMRTGEPVSGIEHAIEHPDGARVILSVNAAPLRDAAGNLTGMVAALTDITERTHVEAALRQSEARYRLLFEQMLEGFAHHQIICDADGKPVDYCFLQVNPAFEQLTGLRAQDIIGKTVREVLPNTEPYWIEAYGRVALTGQPIQFDNYSQAVGRYYQVTAFSTERGQFAVTFQDITERKQAEQERELLLQQVLGAREQLQTLSRQLLDAQENERREIARELHDEIGQVLTAVRTNLQTLQIAPEPATLQARLAESSHIVDRALEQTRTLALNLRPSLLDDFGLVAALEWYVDREAHRAGFRAELHVEPPAMKLPPALETTCFRVVQAALTNIVRHAHATEVQVGLRQIDPGSGTLELTVRDNGIGFDVPAAHDRARRGASLGLLGMQERVQLAGGQFTIESAPAHGTKIHARLPIRYPLNNSG